MSRKHLLRDFTIGFELEGTYDRYNTNREELTNKLDSLLGGKGVMHSDGSLRAASGYLTFEYSSPVIQYTPKNIKMVLNCLDKLPELHVVINRTCGFHTHISFKGITRGDICWFMASSVANDTYKNFLKMGRTCFYKQPYASAHFLNEAKEYLNGGYMNRFAQTIVTNDKYRSMRIHPQGTLEWRGPRTFLNSNTHKKNVLFLKKLHSLILEINNSLDTEDAPALVKKAFVDSYVTDNSSLIFKEVCEKSNRLMERMIQKPFLINTLPEKVFDKFLDNLKSISETERFASLNKLFAKIDEENIKITSSFGLKFIMKSCTVDKWIRFVDTETFKNNLTLIGEMNQLTNVFKYLISHENVNDGVLALLTSEAIEHFGQANIRTFTYNAMSEIIKYEVKAFKIAASKNLSSLFGEDKARALIKAVISTDSYGFRNSEIYNILMSSPNKYIVDYVLPPVQKNENVAVSNVVTSALESF